MSDHEGGLAHDSADDRAELERLRVELAEARAWAWSFQHRSWSGGWLPYKGDPSQPGQWDWVYPDWLLSPVEPDQQAWWAAPPTDASPS